MTKLVTSPRLERLPVFASALLALALVAGATPAFAGESCHKIDASGDGQHNPDGTTDAQIHGGGLLEGTTHTEFFPTGFDGTHLTFVGFTTFTTRQGTLRVGLQGAFDVTTGEFHADSTGVVDATGKLEGATGDIALSGLEDLSTGQFTEDVTGRICLDLSP